MVICLRRVADLHMSQLIPLPLTVSCSRKSRLVLVLPFWYRLTRVVADKIQRAIKRQSSSSSSKVNFKTRHVCVCPCTYVIKHRQYHTVKRAALQYCSHGRGKALVPQSSNPGCATAALKQHLLIFTIITPAEEGGYVFGSVCLSVCLSVRRITRKLVNAF